MQPIRNNINSNYKEMDFEKLTTLYKSSLLIDVIPFWERHSIDWKHGGYFTCLRRDGSVYDTDKFIWLQARQAWMFSTFYNQLEKKPGWLDIASHGIRFLQKHGMDDNGNWYFSLDQEGHPLIQPYNIFSDCFAAMAFGQYAMASGEESAAVIALNTYNNILLRKNNPKGVYNKAVTKNRPMRNFALPMILCNLTLELKPLLTQDAVNTQISRCVNEVLNVHRDPESGLVVESVGLDGGLIDSFEGRLINPGHIIEAMWFMLEIGQLLKDKKLTNTATKLILSTLDYSWDEKFGGIFYFLDRLGNPLQQLEWDQKLWWVHIETLVALLMAYEQTKQSKFIAWFNKVHDYTWKRFPDPDYGEWFGYLNRQGEVLLSLKGGKWKGCFHVPRGLHRCWRILEELRNIYASEI